MAQINFLVDRQELKDKAGIDDWQNAFGGDIYAMADVMSNFVVDEDNNPVAQEEARKTLGKISFSGVEELFIEFAKLIKDSASPPESGRG